jgi:hypothetical protein
LASFRRMKRAGLAATIKARWICEQAHQQLKEKLGLDHFEGRSWQGLHRHALMTMIAYAFLQHRHLTQVGRKKESTDRRLSLACRPYATPSSISFFDHYLSNAHTAEDEAVKNSGVGKSAKVVLSSAPNRRIVAEGSNADVPTVMGQIFTSRLPIYPIFPIASRHPGARSWNEPRRQPAWARFFYTSRFDHCVSISLVR